MELKEGMYVRTEQGIAKIKKHEHYWVNKLEYNYIVTDTGHNYDIDLIVKSSNNIIDLIEEGDYVNGNLIEMFYDTYNPKTEEYEDILGIAIYTDANMDCIEEIRPLRTIDIKSIVTKEQFESVKYKVC